MGEGSPTEPSVGIDEARRLFPATDDRAYFNTAAVGLASRETARALQGLIHEWTSAGFDFRRGERAADESRSMVASLIDADPADVALIASVSSATGLVAAQFGPAEPGANVVIREREYSSNHFPWRQLVRHGPARTRATGPPASLVVRAPRLERGTNRTTLWRGKPFAAATEASGRSFDDGGLVRWSIRARPQL